MNIKNILITLLFSFISINCFAQNKTVVFFAETLDGISAKVIQKIESSDKFCLAAAFDENKYIKQNIQNLIDSYKIEPMLNIIEPYFSLIYKEISLNSSMIFNKTKNCEDILKNYKTVYRNTFSRYKHGLYLKGSAFNDEVLQMFYQYNILWTMAQTEDETQKGLFLKDGVALFVPYKNLTTSDTKIKQWFNSAENANVIPIILSSWHIKDEQFMLALINFINKNNTIDVQLPINAAFYGYNSKTIKKNISLKTLQNIPKENILKLYLANKEIEEYGNNKVNDEIYTILCDELSNMYSYNVINGILNNNKNSIKMFDISYTNIFRMLNKKLPNINEFQNVLVDKNNSVINDGICKFIKKNNFIVINNESNIFTMFSVYKNNDYVRFQTDVDLTLVDSIDIYIDMNNIAYTGSQKMLKPVNAFVVPEHSWEFAIRVTQKNIYIYKNLANNAELIENIPNESEKCDIKIFSNILKGNPYNWNYQVVAIKDGEVVDFIENKDKKEKMFKSLPLQINMYNYIS
ncbi:MAG: hypothetical protein IKN42_04940 [Elusimicrobia bacterium]|nr:hypothetical protein [Elusimicrobiota bacterium]